MAPWRLLYKLSSFLVIAPYEKKLQFECSNFAQFFFSNSNNSFSSKLNIAKLTVLCVCMRETNS